MQRTINMEYSEIRFTYPTQWFLYIQRVIIDELKNTTIDRRTVFAIGSMVALINEFHQILDDFKGIDYGIE